MEIIPIMAIAPNKTTYLICLYLILRQKDRMDKNSFFLNRDQSIYISFTNFYNLLGLFYISFNLNEEICPTFAKTNPKPDKHEKFTPDCNHFCSWLLPG